jgi:hypothetical protein
VISLVALEKQFKLSEPQLPSLESKNNNTYFIKLEKRVSKDINLA